MACIADKKAACEKVGLNYGTAKRYGDVCKQYQMAIRIANCTFKHHQVIAALPEPERLPLLQQAVEKHWSTADGRQQSAWSAGRAANTVSAC